VRSGGDTSWLTLPVGSSPCFAIRASAVGFGPEPADAADAQTNATVARATTIPALRRAGRDPRALRDARVQGGRDIC
jgi:hypothetical protein